MTLDLLAVLAWPVFVVLAVTLFPALRARRLVSQKMRSRAAAEGLQRTVEHYSDMERGLDLPNAQVRPSSNDLATAQEAEFEAERALNYGELAVAIELYAQAMGYYSAVGYNDRAHHIGAIIMKLSEMRRDGLRQPTKTSPADHPSRAEGPLLTPREQEVLAWAARGHDVEEIAVRMGLRPRTVFLHIQNAKNKLPGRPVPASEVAGRAQGPSA